LFLESQLQSSLIMSLTIVEDLDYWIRVARVQKNTFKNKLLKGSKQLHGVSSDTINKLVIDGTEVSCKD